MADFDEVNSNQDMMGTNTDYSIHTASVSDAAAGLAQAKEDNKPSNKYTGNNMISTMSARSMIGDAIRNQRYNK